jgi:ribosomal protein S12 methylthiotransferase accessory factor
VVRGEASLGRRELNPIVLDLGGACPPGMAITKVYVPGLTHACPPRNPTLGHPRFYEIPRQLGFSDRRLTFEDLNPDPIPFA